MGAASGQILKWTGTSWAPGTDLLGNLPGLSEVSNLFVLKSGDTLSGALDMGGNRITNLAAPLTDSEAATKAYVDIEVGTVQSTAVTSVTATGPLASSGGTTPTISLSGQVPDTNITDDLTITSSGSVDGGAVKTGIIAAARIDLAIARTDEAVMKAGGTMAGYLTLSGDPADDLHATPRKYVTNVVATAAAERVSKSGDTMTGALNVPSLFVSGTNDWYVGTDIDQPTHIVMMSAGGEIQSISDLALRAPDGKILFKSPVKFEGGIDNAFMSGRTNEVVTDGNGVQITAPGCTASSVVLITPTTNSAPAKFWIETTQDSFTVKSATSETWSFCYMVR
jgi:hypothetical protein